MLKKTKYIKVNGCEIILNVHECIRIFEYNDYHNVINHTVRVLAKDIFDKHEVPLKFQNVFIKIQRLSLTEKTASEAISEYGFDYKRAYRTRNNDTSYISLKSFWTRTHDILVNDKVTLKTKYVFTKPSEVKYFYRELLKSGYKDNYLEALSEIFGISKDLDDNLKLTVHKKIS